MVSAFLIANFAVWFGIGAWAQFFAPRHAVNSFSFPVQFKGGVVAFVPSAVGHNLEWGFWAHFIALGVLALIGCWHAARGRTERIVR
jgi:hypothetical protein